jgi:hypothetical protein
LIRSSVWWLEKIRRFGQFQSGLQLMPSGNEVEETQREWVVHDVHATKWMSSNFTGPRLFFAAGWRQAANL